MGFGLGHIFRDVIDDFDFFERIIGDGPGGYVSDDFSIDFQFIGILLSLQLGLYPSPYSEEQRQNAQPPVLPGTPPPTFELIIPDPPPDRVTGMTGFDTFAFGGFHNAEFGDHFQLV